MIFESEKLPPEAGDDEGHQKHLSRADITLTLVILGVLGIISIAFARSDIAALGHDPLAVGSLVNRGLTASVLTCAAIVLARSTNRKTFDRAIITMLIAIVLSTTHVLREWRPNYLAYLPVNLVFVSVLWFVMPGPLVARGLTAVALSVITLRSAADSTLPLVARHAAILSHIFAHLLGLPIAIRLVRLDRERFQAQLAEKRARKQLAAAKERAEALARAKSDFLATMSHEFRTPMNAVLGLSEVLAHSSLTPVQHETIKTIHNSAEGLLVLLNDILDHAKIDAGRMTLDPRSIDIHELVENAVATIRYKTNEKHLTVEVSSSPTVPHHIWGDGPRLRQILVNLLSNAVKFTDIGKVRLDIDSRVLGDQKHEIRLRVEDTGIGISEENLERIFSPFEQANTAIRVNRGGTGLGLSISRNLAQLMGGSLTARSVPGKGSIFEFVFPTKEAEPSETPVAPHTVDDESGSPLRILVVEDNRTNQRVAMAMLEQLGYTADMVENGKIAVEQLEKTFYDVIFMDRHMPELDGLQATIRIRELPGKRPYIVAMTASAFADDRAACADAGMDDFVAKPVRLEDLRRALLRARKRTVSSTQRAVVEVQGPLNHDALPVLDRAPLEQLRTLETLGEPGFLRNLCADFIRDSEVRIEGLPNLILAGDARTVEREAHSMKSASASMGTLRVSATCAEIERLAHGETLDPCGPLVVRLRREFFDAKVDLERELADAPSSIR